MPGSPAVLALFLLAVQLVQGQNTSPLFQTTPNNITLHQSGTLPCSASGTPTPVITWYKNGAVLGSDSRLNQTTSGLLVTGLQLTNGQELEGEYQCQASNAAGTVRSLPATLTRTVWSVGAFSSVFRTVPLFSSQVFSCPLPLSSVPQASITWTGPQLGSNSVGVSQDGRLVFSAYNPAMRNSFETYRCMISNDISMDSFNSLQLNLRDQTATTLVVTATVVVPPLSQQTLVAGDTLLLDCFTSGNPVPAVSWSRNGVSLTASGRIQLLQSSRQLQITGVESADAGSYTCSLRQDNMVQATATGSVEVIVPPRVLSTFSATSANVTQSFSLSCSSEGTAPLEWVWYRDATPLSQSGRVQFNTAGSSSTLTVTSLEEADMGVYQCVVSQRATGRRHAHNQLVEVKVVPPMFQTSTSRDVIIITGTVATLPCIATGLPAPTFRWYRNIGSSNPQIVDLSDVRYSIPDPGTGNGSLTINPTSVSDTNTYVCEADNSASGQGGVRDPNNIFVKVINVPIQTETPPISSIPSIGDDVTLPCLVTVDLGVTVRYRWTKNGVVFGGDNRVTGALVITSVREGTEDSGNYECSAVLTADGANSAPLVVRVGSTILTVEAPPEPPSKPGISPPTDVSHASFLARWTAPSQTGGLPLVSYSLELRARGSNFCTLNSDLWVEVGTGLAPSTRSLSVNQNVFPGMGYEYRVTVFNAVFNNTSDSSELFTTPTHTPLVPPTNIRVIARSSSGITIAWATPTPCQMLGGTLTGYFISISSQATPTSNFSLTLDTTSYLIDNLRPATTYNITMAARNDQGVGVASRVIMVTTMDDPTEAPPLPSPENAAISSFNSTSVSLSWAPPTTTPTPVLNYTVKYIARDGIERTVRLPSTQLGHRIGGLSPGFFYSFRIQAIYQDDTSSPPTNVSVTLPQEGGTGILAQTWFYGAVAGGGALFLVIAGVLIVCICYQCCRMGSYKVNVHRTTSGVSNASSHFMEYQRKGKKKQTAAVTLPHVTVHQSPTPSVRSTDYAIPNILQSHTQQPTSQQQELMKKKLMDNFSPPPPKFTPYGPGLEPLGSNISSTGPPSTANFTSSAQSTPEFSSRTDIPYPSNNVNSHGNQHHHHHHHHQNHTHQPHPYVGGMAYGSDPSYPEDSSTQEDNSPFLDNRFTSNPEEMRRSSATATQKFQDTLQRVHTPPMSVQNSEQGIFVSEAPPTSSHQPMKVGVTSLARQNHKGKMGSMGQRSESLMSSESCNSLDYRGPSRINEDPHQLMVEGTRYQAPTPQIKRSKKFISQQGSQDFSDNYLTRADEITMSEMNIGHGVNGGRFREDVDGHPITTSLTHHRNWGEVEPQGFSQGAVPVVISYGPKVHMSHSTYIQNGRHLSSDYDSDPPYDVPPTRDLHINQNFHQSHHSIYQHPPPTYAAPPPPSSDDDLDDLPRQAVQLNAVPTAGGMALSNSEHRLHVLPVGNILSVPSLAAPLPIPTERDVKSTSHSRTPSGSNFTSTNSSVSKNKTSHTSPPILAQQTSIPVPVPPPSIPIPPHSNSFINRQQTSAIRSADTSQQKSTSPSHQDTTSYPRIKTIPSDHMNTREATKPSSKETTPTDHSPTNNGSKTLLESSSSSSISSNWSIDHMTKHFEKLVRGFEDLDPLDEGEERIPRQPMHEGSEGVDWDTPSGPHLVNGRSQRGSTSKMRKPAVAQKPQVLKRPPFTNGMAKGHLRNGSHGYSADEEEPMAGGKRLKVPDPVLRRDPRQPVLKVKKVQGSAWKPMPINKAIESSSEESDNDSYCSDDTVVAGNTDTLRSAHV